MVGSWEIANRTSGFARPFDCSLLASHQNLTIAAGLVLQLSSGTAYQVVGERADDFAVIK
jgi:hypothetical protein